MAAVELTGMEVIAFKSSCLYFYNYSAGELCSLQSRLFVYKFLSVNVSEKELNALRVSVLLPLPHDTGNALCHN